MFSGLKSTMVNVGFVFSASRNWLGGFHYLKNLLYAISTLNERRIEPVLFAGTKVEGELVEPIKPYCNFCQISILDRYSLNWLRFKLEKKLFNEPIGYNQLLKKYNISVLSHVDQKYLSSRCPVISWIPDFQYVHLPEMFSPEEISFRKRKHSLLAQKSNVVILSSKAAKKDFERQFPGNAHKARVLHFVSQPNYKACDIDIKQYLKRKYNIQRRFFYLPNQFWKHKNHKIVFEAVKQLKDKGENLFVVCSGMMKDYRNSDHIEYLKNYIVSNNLEGNICLLGLIDYEDVFYLMRQSIAVINPSLFEGWSSTVEEAKSLGKKLILSDIEVHREQNPPASKYFRFDDCDALCSLLKEYWHNVSAGPNKELERNAQFELKERTRRFALQYQSIVLESFSKG